MSEAADGKGKDGKSVYGRRARREAPLRDCVRESIEEFFEHLDGHPCRGLYDLVMAEVEAPLLEAVMRHTGGNQSSAAEILGMNRGTLRKKLRVYKLL